MTDSQRECCARYIAEKEPFCGECGAVRCSGFEVCRQFVQLGGQCPSHVNPGLRLARPVPRPSVGDSLTLPFVLENNSRNGNPLLLHRIRQRSGDEEWREIELLRDNVRAGDPLAFNVQTTEFTRGGTIDVRLLIELSTPIGISEERYAFQGALIVDIAKADSQRIHNIHVEGGMGTGSAIQIPNFAGPAAERPESIEPELIVQRAGKYELENGLRGYTESLARVSPRTEVKFNGFLESEIPPPYLKPFLLKPSLSCGRNSREYESPNDVRLLACDPNGNVVADQTRRISGHHFELFLANDRLNLRSLGGAGTLHNTDLVPKGGEVVLSHGDRISPLPKAPTLMQVRVHLAPAKQRIIPEIVLERVKG